MHTPFRVSKRPISSFRLEDKKDDNIVHVAKINKTIKDSKRKTSRKK